MFFGMGISVPFAFLPEFVPVGNGVIFRWLFIEVNVVFGSALESSSEAVADYILHKMNSGGTGVAVYYDSKRYPNGIEVKGK